MSDNSLLILSQVGSLPLACAALLTYILMSRKRRRMAALVREAMNAAYDDLEFLKVNHVPAESDKDALCCLEAACTIFSDARNELLAGHHKRAIQLALQTSATLRSIRDRLICLEYPKPFGPSCRVISEDGLVWMGR